VRQREADYRQILARAKVGSSGTAGGSDPTHQFDHLFFMGDLNYRIDIPFDGVLELCAKGGADAEAPEWAALQAQDQLAKERSACRSFLGFREASARRLFTALQHTLTAL
jgi:hypothetical protein